jgi:hypothetical protein
MSSITRDPFEELPFYRETVAEVVKLGGRIRRLEEAAGVSDLQASDPTVSKRPKPCLVCGVTGARHGVGDHFNVDHVYQVTPDPTVSDGATFEEDVEAELVFHREALPAKPGVCMCGHTWPCLVLDLIAALQADRALIETKDAEIERLKRVRMSYKLAAESRGLEMDEAQSEAARYREALERIASCEARVAETVVNIARAALECSAPAKAVTKLEAENVDLHKIASSVAGIHKRALKAEARVEELREALERIAGHTWSTHSCGTCHPCIARAALEGSAPAVEVKQMVRLSIPGNACTNCGTVIGPLLSCPGCGWVDPVTKAPEEPSR